ncbi:hypothetical protein ACEPAF_4657 [Sanghuangporus sanghuang]
MVSKAPRPSASLIVVNSENEVLMVQRDLDSRSFAGAHVFPGGNFDQTQDSSLEMTAIRETFEETGILLASRASGFEDTMISENVFEEARKAIHTGKRLFADFLSERGLVPDITSLLPFSTWVTPPQVPRRFRTCFFVTFLPVDSALFGPSSGTQIHRLPTPDSPDNEASASTEVVSAQFVHPRDLLSAFSREEIGLMPPQFYILSILQDIFKSGSDSSVNTPTQREQIQRISKSYFGRTEFNPRFDSEASFDGNRALILEGDETRGGKKGQLHRILFVPRKTSPLPRQLQLIRNFDIFTGFGEPEAAKSKL